MSTTGTLRLCLSLTVLLGQHGISSAPQDPASGTVSQRQIVITIDDLPGAVPGSDSAVGNVRDLKRDNNLILKALKKHNAPALGLVIESKLQVAGERDVRVSILNQWIVKGMELGNHTYSHTRFSKLSLNEFEDDTVKADVVTKRLLAEHSETEHYFRYPALDRGRGPEDRLAFERFLTAHGYQVAPVSVENADYQFNDVLVDSRAHHTSASVAEAKASYLRYTVAMLDYVEGSSQMLFGRQIPQILLIHDNELNAEMLDALLTMLELRSYHFVRLGEALKDPAYGDQAAFHGNLDKCDLCWSNRLSTIGRQPLTSPDPPTWITKRFTEIRALSGN